MNRHPRSGRYTTRPPTMPKIGFSLAHKNIKSPEEMKYESCQPEGGDDEHFKNIECNYVDCFVDVSDASSMEEEPRQFHSLQNSRPNSSAPGSNNIRNATEHMTDSREGTDEKYSDHSIDAETGSTSISADNTHSKPKSALREVSPSLHNFSKNIEEQQKKTDKTQQNSRNIFALLFSLILFISNHGIFWLLSIARAIGFYFDSLLRLPRRTAAEKVMIHGAETLGDSKANKGFLDDYHRRENLTTKCSPGQKIYCKSRETNSCSLRNLNNHNTDKQLEKYNQLITEIGMSAKERLKESGVFDHLSQTSDDSHVHCEASKKNAEKNLGLGCKYESETRKENMKLLFTSESGPDSISRDGACDANWNCEYLNYGQGHQAAKKQISECSSPASDSLDQNSCTSNSATSAAESTQREELLTLSRDEEEGNSPASKNRAMENLAVTADNAPDKEISAQSCSSHIPVLSTKSSRRAFKFDPKGFVKTLRETRRKSNEGISISSPRPAQKTVAIISDILSNELGCRVITKGIEKRRLEVEKMAEGGSIIKMRIDVRVLDDVSSLIMFHRARENRRAVADGAFTALVNDVQQAYMYRITRKK